MLNETVDLVQINIVPRASGGFEQFDEEGSKMMGTSNDNDIDGNKRNNAPLRQLAGALWHGLGLFGESYLLFSVGTLRPIWEALYPACFDEDDATVCGRPYLSYRSITYAVVLGVMAGMVALGALANTIGRRRGSILTASLMALGAMGLTTASIFLSSVPSTLFPVMSLCLFVFGIGVGGEYPLSASSASERAMSAMKRRQLDEAERTQQKAKRLLSSSASAGTAQTPKRGNLAQCHGDDDGKKQSLLRENVPAATATPWQTLDAKSASNGKRPQKLSIEVEESYGDVPLSPTNVTNHSLASCNASLRTRGREVLLVFSMQGMGIFANSLILTCLLMFTRKRNGSDQENVDDDAAAGVEDATAYYDPTTLLNIWRITYGTGAAVLVYVLVSRISHLTESEVWARDREQREEERKEQRCREENVGFRPPEVGPHERRRKHDATAVETEKANKQRSHEEEPVISPTMSSITMRSEFDLLGSTNLDACRRVPTLMPGDSNGRTGRPSELRLLFRHYGVRLFGTSVSWLLWDVAFYGNKMFQSAFLIACVGEDASLVDITGASAINAFVALLGYYAAAAIVDDPDCGRLALQQIGFVVTGTLFLLCGCLNDRLPSTWLVIMYFGSSFFGQCGPNCTTFLIPAEVFPTSMRALCHGISACCGKCGALVASILFNFVGERDLFLASGYASFAASLVTFLTIPETTTLDLYEIDKQWHKVLLDETYEGPATDPKHLSFYERNQNRPCWPRRK